MTIVTLITMRICYSFSCIHAHFSLSVKGVKCTTIITWLNDQILLRDVCIEEKNDLLNTSDWTNSVTHIKQYRKKEIESKWRASYVDW
jgi:hypothetical protein